MNTKTTQKKTKNYINNADFVKALVEYKEKVAEAKKLGKAEPPTPNYIGSCFLQIAQGLSRNWRFISYTYKDEMISDGILNCMLYFHNFNVEKTTNAFGYFTKIIYWAFVRRLKREKQEQYVKYKSFERMGFLDEGEIEELESESGRKFELYDNISTFINDFEDKMKKKKKPAKKPKGLEQFMEQEIPETPEELEIPTDIIEELSDIVEKV